MSTPEDLMTDAIEELEAEDVANRHENHEQYDLDGCSLCRQAFAEAAAEHAWMGQAVKTWTGGNPYAPEVR